MNAWIQALLIICATLVAFAFIGAWAGRNNKKK